MELPSTLICPFSPGKLALTYSRIFSDNLGWGTPPQIYLVFLMKFEGVKSQNFVAALAEIHKYVGTFLSELYPCRNFVRHMIYELLQTFHLYHSLET